MTWDANDRLSGVYDVCLMRDLLKYVVRASTHEGGLKSPCATRVGVLNSVLRCACILLLNGQLRCCCWPLSKRALEFSVTAAACCLCVCVSEWVRSSYQRIGVVPG